MIKVIGCVFIIGASTAFGFILAEGFKKRSQELKELLRAVLQLENEIMYTRTPLPEACINVAEKSKQTIGNIFRAISSKLKNNKADSVYGAFKEALEEIKKITYLNKDDCDIILDLAKALGDVDIEGHKKVFRLAEDYLKNNINDADLKLAKNMKMYRYLGFSVGAAVAILLV